LLLGDKPVYDAIYIALAAAFIVAVRRFAATIKEPTPKVETQTQAQSLSASQVARDLYVTSHTSEEVSNHT
jgi:hypothetical protein